MSDRMDDYLEKCRAELGTLHARRRQIDQRMVTARVLLALGSIIIVGRILNSEIDEIGLAFGAAFFGAGAALFIRDHTERSAVDLEIKLATPSELKDELFF